LRYIGLGPGVTPEAIRWLYERGVRVMGIGDWGWDRPPGSWRSCPDHAAPLELTGRRCASPGSS